MSGDRLGSHASVLLEEIELELAEIERQAVRLRLRRRLEENGDLVGESPACVNRVLHQLRQASSGLRLSVAAVKRAVEEEIARESIVR